MFSSVLIVFSYSIVGMPQMMFRPPPIRPGLQALGMRMPPGE